MANDVLSRAGNDDRNIQSILKEEFSKLNSHAGTAAPVVNNRSDAPKK